MTFLLPLAIDAPEGSHLLAHRVGFLSQDF